MCYCMGCTCVVNRKIISYTSQLLWTKVLCINAENSLNRYVVFNVLLSGINPGVYYWTV